MTRGGAFMPAAIMAATGAVVVAASAVAAPKAALAAWLAMALFVTAIPAGAMALLLTAQFYPGKWTALTGDALRRAAATMPAAALVMAPVLLLAAALYGWGEDIGARRGLWLEPEIFLLRGATYLALWWLFAWLAPPISEVRQGLASAGLLVYAVTASLAGMDWVISLQAEAYSAVFGLIFIAHQMLAGLAFAVLVALARQPVDAAAARGLGNMLLGGLMLWLYLEFMQYLVAWSGDLHGHTAYYLKRAEGGWAAVIWFIGLAGGALPFLALLWRRVRGSVRALVAIAALILFTRALEACWWVLPLYGPGWVLGPLTAAAFAGGAGLLLAAWLRPGRRRATAGEKADG